SPQSQSLHHVLINRRHKKGARQSKPDGAFAQSRRGFHVDLGTREKDVGIEPDRRVKDGLIAIEVVEDGYEFFAKRRLVTIFSAPNYGWEFDNAGALSSVDQSLVCSFEILKPAPSSSGIALKKVCFSLHQEALLLITQFA
ncbi:hypothetical protein IGI04_031874, partial [Brassica rapa subsp. trilocularis]